MASSRHMRRSRRASPMDNPNTESMSIKNESVIEDKNEGLSEEWIEPPLRAPAPSFEDHKGLERHGVLEHMQPLGSLPNSKVKARLKLHEPARRVAHLRNGEPKVAKEELHTPEPVLTPAPPVTRRSEPRKTEERTTRASLSRDKDEDYEYIPTPNGKLRNGSTTATSTSTTPNGITSPRIAQNRAKLEQIVDSAVLRSKELGDPVLGKAVKDLYEESLRDPRVADLLDSVLNKNPSPQQTIEFQTRIRTARKKHKEAIAAQNQPSKLVSDSPVAKSSRSSVIRHSDTPKILSSPPPSNKISTNYDHQSAKPCTEVMATNGSPPKEERPSKRIKRSKSASSDSSLSSLDSTIEEFSSLGTPRSITSNHVTNQGRPQSNSKPSSGPRMGTFPIRPTDPMTRRPHPLLAALTDSIAPGEDIVARRREEMRQRYLDATGDQRFQDSAVRVSPSPVYVPQPKSPLAALTERSQKARLRNGSVQRRGRDEYDSLDSPASSSFGDHLIPPPPGASRGATPYQLGRPPKSLKKVARIKMSPLKKRNTTTAGRGAEAEGSMAGHVISRTDSSRVETSQSDGSSDVCIACSGDGSLLCCDGCTRAFHFTCCEPPMDVVPKGEWLCNKCTEERTTSPSPTPGIFEVLLGDLNKKNPVSYALPQHLREYYEGIKTGEDGEFEETNVMKANKTRSGYDELPNNFKLKDNKDNSILCFRCSGSSMGHREIVSCDYCNLSWHLDCLDPPLATAPKKKQTGSKPKTTAWMCPNHIEPHLSSTGHSANNPSKTGAKRFRGYKIRRPKVVSIVDSSLRRGFKNNGLIEIENEPSDEEKFTKNMSGQIYRVHERGIKLDFIDRVKRTNEEAAQRQQLGRAAAKTHDRSRSVPIQSKQDSLEGRPFNERKAAFNLVQMAKSEESALSADRVKNLIGTLVAEAPDDVGKLIEITDSADRAEELLEEERRDLQTLIELAFRRLAAMRA